MNKGIVIICLGNPYYGRLAFNLAVSIKNVEPTCNIAIIHDGSTLKHLGNYDLTKYFSHIIEAPKEAYNSNGITSYFKAKLFAYEFSPFDETIYLDADMVWLVRKPSELFESLKDVEFSAITEGYYDFGTDENKVNKRYQLWGEIDDIKREYNPTGKLYQFRSEFMYFKKSESNKAFFDLAIEIYDNPKITFFKVGEVMPDELALNISGALLKHYPHQDNYCPVYWYFIHLNKWNDKKAMYNNYYAMSVGGNSLPEYVRFFYDRLVAACFSKIGIKHPFKIQNKRSWLPERKSI